MVLIGTILGSIICMANMYFGLQIGIMNTMSPSTALMSFAIFKSCRPWIQQTFTPTENVVVQTIASSIAGMPLAASFTGIIPAFEFLRQPDEGDVLKFSNLHLILWALGVSLFGTVFAAPFRNYFLRTERLRFPGGFATGVLVGVLHGDDQIARNAHRDKRGELVSFDGQDAVRNVPSPHNGDGDVHDGGSDIASLSGSEVALILKGFAGAAGYVSDPFLCYEVILLAR